MQEGPRPLVRFYRHEALWLAEARRRCDEHRWPAPQRDRDALFIRARRTAKAGDLE